MLVHGQGLDIVPEDACGPVGQGQCAEWPGLHGGTLLGPEGGLNECVDDVWVFAGGLALELDDGADGWCEIELEMCDVDATELAEWVCDDVDSVDEGL